MTTDFVSNYLTASGSDKWRTNNDQLMNELFQGNIFDALTPKGASIELFVLKSLIPFSTRGDEVVDKWLTTIGFTVFDAKAHHKCVKQLLERRKWRIDRIEFSKIDNPYVLGSDTSNWPTSVVTWDASNFQFEPALAEAWYRAGGK